MFIVDRPLIQPGMCVISGKTTSEAGFIDLGPYFYPDPHLYLEVDATIDLARNLLGMVSQAEYAELEAKLDKAESDLERAQAEVVEAQRYLDAIDILESKDFRSRRKPGPPKRVEATA